VLLVAPSLAGVGGIEASGKLAWESLSGPHRSRDTARLFCYGAVVPDVDGGSRARVIHARSKAGAALLAATMPWPDRGALIWHLGLLKLLPFFRLRRARIGLFLHGVEAWRRLDPWTRRLLRRVDVFLTNSTHTWREFLRFNPEWSAVRPRTVHLGVGSPVVGPLPAPDPRPIVLMLSRLVTSEDYKGHREVIRAWPRVLARLPDAELWIAGDGDLRPDLESRARALGSPGAAIRFVGTVSEVDKQGLLTRCRCLAMPSRSEGFGLVYLEAMRLGRPCLVGTEDAGREVVNPPEAGVAVRPDDPGELTDGLCQLLSAGVAWERLAAQARRRYEHAFTAAHFQLRLEDALSDAGLLDG